MRKKRENGMAKESGMGDFPRKQFESVLLHSLRIMDQNREYLQMHLARTGDERTRQALEDMGQESIRLERTLREMMGLLEVEMNDKPSMKPVDLCWILMEAAQIAPEIEKQLGIRLTVDHSPFRRCYVKADAQEAEQLLFHLLSNALRAVSPGGQIKIRLTRDDEDLYLIVEDDGCGLPTGENWMENRRRFLGGVQAVDWQKRESARAKMRMLIKKLLKKHRYPPEGMEDAVQTVMTQCELWTDNNDMVEEKVVNFRDESISYAESNYAPMMVAESTAIYETKK